MGEPLWVSASADGYAKRGCGLSRFLQIRGELRLKRSLWEKEVATEFSSSR